jgi:hypothetical protein
MAWLDRLDKKAASWPTPARWSYVALKWYLIALGAFALIRVSLDRTGIWPFY